MRVYERIVWPLLSRWDPEHAHERVLRWARLVQSLPPALRAVHNLMPVRDPRLQVSWQGLIFPNPIGLSAGLDKDALAPRFFQALGFGFVEVGTVTPRGQPGNPRPRIHRLPERGALINSMGFPGEGAESMARRLHGMGPLGVPLGINLGKNAATPLESAAEDYVRCLELLYPYGDYFVINVSSPNTMGLTSLQARPALRRILEAVAQRRAALSGTSRSKPLALKVSPDLTNSELDDVLAVSASAGIEGIIATNTSVDPLRKGPAEKRPGGISGRPLANRALEVVSYVRRNSPAGLFVIGVGGVADVRGALALMDAGANVVQVYTAFIYKGPGLPGLINRGLLSLMDKGQIGTLAER